MLKHTLWANKTTLIALALSLFSIQSEAHPGGLDSNGCHNNGALGVYECHSGANEGTTWANREEFEAAVSPVVTPPSSEISFASEPDWSTLTERQMLFRSGTTWTVSDGQYLYSLERTIENGEYRFKPVSRAKIKSVSETEYAQIISGFGNAN